MRSDQPRHADVPGERQHGGLAAGVDVAPPGREMEPTRDPPHHGGVLRSYYAVFGSLMGLTILTVLAAQVEIPERLAFLHTPIAFAIAGIKATLVVLFFMHLWHSPRLIWLIAFGSLLWLAIMFVLTYSDYATRGYVTRDTPPVTAGR
jgi:cytochrome c oxidase subunit 4